MPNEGFGELVRNSLNTGTQPDAVAISELLNDGELRHAMKSRRLTYTPGLPATTYVRSQIEGMLPAAYKAYEHNVRILNELSEDEIKRISHVPLVAESVFMDGAMDALTEPTLEYMESVVEENHGTTLWVPKSAPYAEFSPREILNLADINGQRFGRQLKAWTMQLEALGQYGPSQLSDYNPYKDTNVIHLFAPTTLTPRLKGNLKEQRDALEELKAENPGVNILSPSLAHSVCGWAILGYSELKIPVNMQTTFDRSVDTMPQTHDGNPCTPSSFVNKDHVEVGLLSNRSVTNGRAWVGSAQDLAA